MRPKYLWRTMSLAALLIVAAPPRGVDSEARATLPPVAAVQCRRTDCVIRKFINLGFDSPEVRKGTVRRCTSHEYSFDADYGEKLTIKLATGKRTSFTLRTPSGEIVEGADGVKNWSGITPQVGNYHITIGTDATAPYTLTVKLG